MAASHVKVEGLNRMVRDLQRLGVEVDDLKATFSEIAAEGAQIASGLAPKRTGKLAASIRGNKAKNKAVVTAGKARVPYAGAINYGWPKRGIKPALFMQKADEQIAPKAVERLDRDIQQHIKRLGLS